MATNINTEDKNANSYQNGSLWRDIGVNDVDWEATLPGDTQVGETGYEPDRPQGNPCSSTCWPIDPMIFSGVRAGGNMY